MRIIGGIHGGRLLRPPKGLPVRPTTDLAKESLFNILNNRVDFEDISVLDLFSGTGNIAVEFASRGARQVVAVEIHAKCAVYIRSLAESLQLNNLVTVKTNVFNYLTSYSKPYDIIFADPPYEMKESALIPDIIFERQLLHEGGWLILEHDVFVTYDSHPCFEEERHYGKVHFSFFRKKGEEANT